MLHAPLDQHTFSLLSRRILPPFMLTLQPSEKLLFAREHISRFIAHRANNLVAGFREPGHAMRNTTVLLFVRPLASPIIDGHSAPLPVTEGIPMARFIGPQVLMRAETCIAPELGNPVEPRINSRRNALPFRITSPNQQHVAAGSNMFHQRAHPLYGIGWHQPLLGENVFELLVIFIGKGDVMRLFNRHTAFLCLPDATAAS